MTKIAKMYAEVIVDGKWSYDRVPLRLKNEVDTILTEMGRADLIAK